MEENKPTQAGGTYVPSIIDKIKTRFSGLPWYLWIFLIIALITSLLLGIYYIFPAIKQRMSKPEPTPKAFWTPSPIPILGGTQTYKISGGTTGLPLITELTLNPQDATKGQNQTITIKANGPTAIKEVIAVLRLDDEHDFEYKLDFKEGTATNGTWSKTISFPYTNNYTYRVNVKARNENNLGNISTITIR